MKINVCISIFLIFCLQFLHAQSIVGVVKDSTTGESLPFVNMALLKNLIGCSSQTDGTFELNIDKHTEDTLVISAIGYIKKYIPIKSILGKKSEISLRPNIYELSEVVIKPNDKKIKKTYYKLISPNKSNEFEKILKVGYQEAIFIENKMQKVGKIESVIIELEKYDVFEKRPYVDFRIRIYSYDKKNNIPGNDLLLENLISNAKGGTCTIDVSKYNIAIPLEGIIIGMEYLDSENKTKGKDINVMPRISYSKTIEPLKAWYSFFNRYWKDGSQSVVRNGGYYYPMLGIKMSVEEEKK